MKDKQDPSETEASDTHATREETTAEGSTADTAELLAQLDKAQAEAQAHQERAMRAVADLDNYRRRAAREMEQSRLLANAGLIEELLPALDNLQLGLMAASNHPEAEVVTKGFEVVAQQLLQILAEHGLDVIKPDAGEVFDHNLHEAVSQQASESIADDHVITLVRVGYRLNERLLRPASVIVSSGQPASS
ncbi:MAG: nucleotide exchange factor GrpE [Verrucomicrobiota bacterium]